jgi:putative transposase
LRKIIKNRGHFPSDEAAIKPLWLALTNVMKKTERKAFDWLSAMNEFAIQFDGRLNLNRA